MAGKVAIMQSSPEMQPGHNQNYGTANHDQVKCPKSSQNSKKNAKNIRFLKKGQKSTENGRKSSRNAMAKKTKISDFFLKNP